MNFNIRDVLILIFLGKSLNYVVFVKFRVRDSDPLGRRLACKAPFLLVNGEQSEGVCR